MTTRRYLCPACDTFRGFDRCMCDPFSHPDGVATVEVFVCPVADAALFAEHCSCYAYLDWIVIPK